MSWFNVDKQGLAAILERRGKAFALFELIQNAWDSGTDRVDVTLTPIAGQPYATLAVEDRGEGLADLSESHTMFGRSRRADDPLKRGRFNLGEKLVLAICRTAIINTRCGSIEFREDGTVRRSQTDNRDGTTFTGEIRMTRDEYQEVCEAMMKLCPPVATSFNGTQIGRHQPLTTFKAKLPTEIADAEGQLRRTVRLADVEVYEADGTGELLEMGIPIVETENGYRVNVLQKIPLNMDRDNVTPAFLRTLNAHLLNIVHGDLTQEDAALPWVQEATGNALASSEAVKTVVTKRFGEHAVVATPGDPMANANAAASGFTVIPGGAMSADAWANVRKHQVLQPSSKVFPTPTPDALANMAQTKCPVCGK